MAGGRFSNLETGSSGDQPSEDVGAFPSVPDASDDLSTQPLSFDETMGRADEQFYSGEWKKALTLYSRALNLDTRDRMPWVGQVLCLLFMDQIREAEVWSRRALETFPEDIDIVALRGVVVARTGMVKRGVGASDYAMEKNSTSALPWLFRAWMLLEADSENWRPCMDKTTSLVPAGEWRIFVLMGMILEQYRKYSQAITAYKRALEVQTEQFYTWYRLGVCYRKLGMQRPALDAQRQAKALKPFHSGVETELQRSSRGINIIGLFTRWFKKG